MKKSLLTLAVAALGFAACTNTEDIESGVLQTAKQIGFESHVNKNSRALVNENFNKFSVFGSYVTATNTTPVQIFNNIAVSKNGTDWKYTDAARYWIKDANYTFYAYSKENGTTGTSRFTGAELTLEDYTVDDTEANQKDLVFAAATATGKENGNEKVAFDFKHILSKLHFTFESNFPTGYTVTVDQVKIRNMRDKGTFTASTGVWSGQWRSNETEVADEMLTIAVPFADENANKVLNPKETVETNDIYVLPFAYTQPNVRLYFRLTIKNANGETVSQKENYGAFKPTWAIGTAYNYKVTLTGAEAGLEKIEFTTDPNMDLDGWTPGTDDVEFNFGAEVQNN